MLIYHFDVNLSKTVAGCLTMLSSVGVSEPFDPFIKFLSVYQTSIMDYYFFIVIVYQVTF